MKENAARCIANTLVHEGGYTNDPNDPGNWTGGKQGVGRLLGTKYGIAANTYPNLDIKNLTKDQAIALYERDFWPKVAGDQMPKGIDQLAYDGGVNSGPSRGVGWIAKACGVKSSSASVVAVAAAAQPDKIKLAKAAAANRMSFLRGLSTFGRYGKGWTRRVAQMEALAVKMISEGAANDNDARPELRKQASRAKTASNANATASGGTVAGSGETARQQAPDLASIDWTSGALLAVGAVVVIMVAGYFLYKWYIHRERARAYEDLAANRLEVS